MVFKQYTVKIPKDAAPQKDGRVNIVTLPYPGYNRKIIGWVCGEGVMHPCSAYFERYPNEWKEQYPDQTAMLHVSFLRAGMFVLSLRIGSAAGIYPALADVYGADTANGIMDFAMYLGLGSSEDAGTFGTAMRDQLVFSLIPREESWYAALFSDGMDEKRSSVIRDGWLQNCINGGLTKVCLIILGTCKGDDGRGSELSQKEHGKSVDGGTWLPCVWAVCAEGAHRGLPLTYFVSEQNSTIVEVLKAAVDSLRQYKLQIKGALLDSMFCTEGALRFFHEEQIDYIAMLGKDAAGRREMLRKYKEYLKDNLDCSFRQPEKFGIADKGHILSSLDFESNIVLVYDTLNAASIRVSFLEEVFEEKDHLQELSAKGKKPDIPDQWKEYLYIDPDTNTVRMQTETLKSFLDEAGYYAFGTSLNEPAEVIDQIFALSDSLKAVFAEAKKQTRLSAPSSKSDTVIRNLLFCVFLAGILRSEIQNTCIRHKLAVDETMQEAAELGYAFRSTYYEYAAPMPENLIPLFAQFHLNDESFQSVQHIVKLRYEMEEGQNYPQAKREFTEKLKRRSRYKKFAGGCQEESIGRDGFVERADPENTQEENYQTYPAQDEAENVDSSAAPAAESGNSAKNTQPREEKVPKKRGRKPKPRQEKPKGPGRGRVKGSKNRKTLERERLIAEGLWEEPPKRPVGRPKSPETIAREEKWERIREIARERGIELPEKRKPGYPSNLIREIEAQIEEEGSQTNKGVS